MTNEELQAKKRAFETRLLYLLHDEIKAFEEATPLKITNVDVNFVITKRVGKDDTHVLSNVKVSVDV